MPKKFFRADARKKLEIQLKFFFACGGPGQASKIPLKNFFACGEPKIPYTIGFKTFFFLIIPVRASRGEKKRKPEKNNYFFQLIIGESAEAKKKWNSEIIINFLAGQPGTPKKVGQQS